MILLKQYLTLKKLKSNYTMSFEAEQPRIEDNTPDYETIAAGFSPTRSGDYVTKLLVKPEIVQEPA